MASSFAADLSTSVSEHLLLDNPDDNDVEEAIEEGKMEAEEDGDTESTEARALCFFGTLLSPFQRTVRVLPVEVFT